MSEYGLRQQDYETIKALKQELADLRARLERWEAYRSEMQDMEGRIAKLSRNFLDLDAYKDAAECAIKADGIRFVVGRMPPMVTAEIAAIAKERT